MIDAEMLLYGFAMLLGLLYLPAVAQPKAFRKNITKFFNNVEATRLSGVLMQILGLLFLATHWEFTNDWMMLIAVMGWAMLLKGSIYLWYPGYPKSKVKAIIKDDGTTAVLGVFGILIAVGFAYVGMNLI